MKIAIMQPTYIPWAGYFNLISQADKFVFLDDVQFAASSWQQRNRIIFNGKIHMLTVPVLVKGRPDQLIREVQTDETQKWRQKHLSILRQAYSRHPHGKAAIGIVEGVLKHATCSLARINVALIRGILPLPGDPAATRLQFRIERGREEVCPCRGNLQSFSGRHLPQRRWFARVH